MLKFDIVVCERQTYKKKITVLSFQDAQSVLFILSRVLFRRALDDYYL